MKKHAAQQTSKDALDSILDTLSESQADVYNFLLKHGPASNYTIAKALEKPINRVTPRTNELVKERLVVAVTKAIQPETNRKVILWDINNEVPPDKGRFQFITSLLFGFRKYFPVDFPTATS